METPAPTSPQMRLMRILERHMDAEYKNDIDLIMATVASHPRYVMGGKGRPTVTFEDRDAVRDMYATARADADLVTQKEVNRIISDWYVFGASNALYRWKGLHKGVDRAGLEYPMSLLAFLPFGTEDALQGEFVYWECTPPEAVERAVSASGPMVSASYTGPEIRDVHDEAILALRSGDVDRLRRLVAEDAQFITRDWDDPSAGLVRLEGIDAIVAYYAKLLGSAPLIDVTTTTFVGSDWYFFAEHGWTLTDKTGVTRERRTAGVFTRDDAGRLSTYFGYGIED